MTPLAAGWEKPCLEAALRGAGFQYTLHATAHGLATFRYGPSEDAMIQLSAQVAAGVLRLTVDPLVVAEGESGPPPIAQLQRANEATIDWTWGSFGYDPAPRAFTASARAFAYPDHVPDAALVQGLCHGLWEARTGLRLLQPPPGPPAPAGMEAIVLGCFAAGGIQLTPQVDGSHTQALDFGDDGNLGLRVSFDADAVRIDALPLASPPWPGTHEAWAARASLNQRLMLGAVTTWGDQVVLRHAVPLIWIPDHPRWVATVIDALSLAAIDVVRLARGGPLDRS